MEGAEQGNSEVFSRREYSRPEFWNDRFRESPHAFDWYVTWKELRKFLLILTHPEDCPSVLMVGCGSSTLSADMGKVGYDVTNIDISDVVLGQMKTGQDCVQMDATKCAFRDKSFDLVLDKGTFDALACAQDSDLPDLVATEMGRLAQTAAVIITHGRPELRQARLEAALAPSGPWRCRALKCELSPMSQFINIMRSKYPDRSIASIFRDKEALAAAVKAMAEYTEHKTVGEGAGEKRQTHCWVYMFLRPRQEQAGTAAQ